MELQRVPLHENHCQLNAKMGPFAGFHLPLQYKSALAEVVAVRKRAGLFDVSHMGEIFIKGQDASRFVDYLITNDFVSLPVGRALYSPICNEEGYLLDDLIAYKLSSTLALLCINAANRKKDRDWIERYGDKFQVVIEDASDSLCLLALQGPLSLKFLPSGFQEIEGMGSYEVREVMWENEKIIVATTGYTGERGIEIFSYPRVARHLWGILTGRGVEPSGLVARDILRLEATYPLYGNELTEETTPLDAGLSWTVKIQKKDFLGKEALKKTSPRFRLLKLSLAKGIPRPGHPILNAQGEEIGQVTSGTHSPTLERGIALARVERSKEKKADGNLFVGIRGKAYKAKIHQKPFIHQP